MRNRLSVIIAVCMMAILSGGCTQKQPPREIKFAPGGSPAYDGLDTATIADLCSNAFYQYRFYYEGDSDRFVVELADTSRVLSVWKFDQGTQPCHVHTIAGNSVVVEWRRKTGPGLADHTTSVFAVARGIPVLTLEFISLFGEYGLGVPLDSEAGREIHTRQYLASLDTSLLPQLAIIETDSIGYDVESGDPEIQLDMTRTPLFFDPRLNIYRSDSAAARVRLRRFEYSFTDGKWSSVALRDLEGHW